MRRRLLILLLTLALFPLPAGASFSDAWDSLRSDPAGVTVTFSSLKVTRLNASENALAVLNGFLSPWTLELQVPAGSGDGLIRLWDSGSGQSAAVAAGREQDGLPYLAAAQALRGLWETALPELFVRLSGEEPPETEEKSTSFSVLGRSPARQSLTVSKALFGVLPKEALDPLISGLKTLFRDYPVSPYVSAYLDRLTLDGELTVRRNLNDEGQDMAYQFAGRIASGGEDVRKLTMIIGKNGDIYYFSVKAPAARGSGNFQAALTVPRLTETKAKASRKITLSIRRTEDRNTWKLNDTLQLTGRKTGNGEISARWERAVESDGVKQTDELTLDLSGGADRALAGRLSFSRRHAAVEVIAWQAEVRAGPGGNVSPDGAVSEEEAAGLLAGLLTQKISRLTPEDRRQLQHLLRTDSWMNGPAVSPLPEPEETEE